MSISTLLAACAPGTPDLGYSPSGSVSYDGGPEVHLLPRPASGDVLVWVDASERSAGWLWDGGAGLTPLDLPADWPEIAYDVAWRADGRAVAGSAGRVNARDEFEGIFVVAEIGGSRTTIVPIVGDYDRLEGWWSRDELRVGHGICTEGCEGRYASSARLRIADRRLVEMRVADRADAPIDEVVPDAGRGVYIRGYTGQWYYASVHGSCPRLTSNANLRFNTSPGGDFDKDSTIRANGWRCMIDSVTLSDGPPRRPRR